MPGLKLFLLGPPRVEFEGEELKFDTRKNMALIAYLAVSGESQSRETLTALLWPELEPSRSRAGLRRNLSVLKKALGGEWLVIDRESVGCDPGADTYLDLDHFRRLQKARLDHNHSNAELCADCLTSLAKAVDLYRGDFMAGFSLRDSPNFDEWQFFQTEDLRHELAITLELLVSGRAAQGDFVTAIPYARRWLELDPLFEPAHRHLMRLYANSGQRAAALRQYGQCKRILNKELGEAPDDYTVQLYRAIKRKQALPQSAMSIGTISQPDILNGHDRIRKRLPGEPSIQETVNEIFRRHRESGESFLSKSDLIFISEYREHVTVDKEGYEILLRCALYHDEPYEHWLSALGSFEEQISILERFYATNPPFDERNRIVMAMARVPGHLSDQVLLDISLQDDSPEVRAFAARASAERGYREEVTAGSLSQAEEGQAAAMMVLVTLAEEYGMPTGMSFSLRLQIGLALARSRWRRYRHDVWNQTRQAAFGGGLLVIYGALVPVMMRLVSPEVYNATLTYMSVTGYYLISIILFGMYGIVQGLATGFGTTLADVIFLETSRSRGRASFGALSGLVSSIYFLGVHLSSENPVPADPPLVLVANITYGLLLGLILSPVIPSLESIRSSKRQIYQIGRSALLAILLSVAHVFIIFEGFAADALVNRVLLALMLPIAIGSLFYRHLRRRDA